MKVLILAQWDWHGPARIPKALKETGCEVSAICKRGDWTSLSSFVDRKVYVDTSDEGQILSMLDHTMRDWRPDLILPGTDNMVGTLARYRHAVHKGAVTLDDEMTAVVDNSLYNPERTRFIGRKIDFLNAMDELGVPIAPQREVVTLGDADNFIQEHGYPVLLKPDEGFSGSGIAFCQNEEEVMPLLQKLVSTTQRPRYAIQKYMGKKTALIEFVAKDGKLLAANSVYRMHTYPGDTGPTSVARVVKGSLMRQAAETMCEFLGYNGLGVAQFMVEDETCENPHLIELNPRMSSFPHLWRLMGTDLVSVMVKAWKGERFNIEPIKEGLTVALYPQEALRERNSEYLQSLRDNVDDDPELADVFEQLIERRWNEARA